MGGAEFLFAPDVALPALAPGFPPSAVWLGQLLGGAWLGMAALNWLQRNAVLGGIYGRPVVLANAALYFVSCTSVLREATKGGAELGMWVIGIVAAAMTVVYGALLFRGPFDPLQTPAR